MPEKTAIRWGWPGRWRASAIAPLLACLIGAFLLAYPLVQLAPLARSRIAGRDAISPGYAARFGSPVELGASTRFRVVAPRSYLTDAEVKALLARAETDRTRLRTALGLPADDRQVTIMLRPEAGVPMGTGATVVVYNYKGGYGAFVHELTHVLTGYNNSFLAEGLAVFMEQRLGWGLAFPAMSRSLDAYAGIAARSPEVSSIAALLLRRLMWNPGDVAASRLRYAASGSFTGHLIESYGISKWFTLFRNATIGGADFETAYGRSLSALEQEWRAAVRRRSTLQAAWLVALGLAVASEMYLAARKRNGWLAAAAIGALAFAAWSYYLVCDWNITAAPAAALLAVLLARLAGPKRPRAQDTTSLT